MTLSTARALAVRFKRRKGAIKSHVVNSGGISGMEAGSCGRDNGSGGNEGPTRLHGRRREPVFLLIPLTNGIKKGSLR